MFLAALTLITSYTRFAVGQEKRDTAQDYQIESVRKDFDKHENSEKLTRDTLEQLSKLAIRMDANLESINKRLDRIESKVNR